MILLKSKIYSLVILKETFIVIIVCHPDDTSYFIIRKAKVQLIFLDKKKSADKEELPTSAKKIKERFPSSKHQTFIFFFTNLLLSQFYYYM